MHVSKNNALISHFSGSACEDYRGKFCIVLTFLLFQDLLSFLDIVDPAVMLFTKGIFGDPQKEKTSASVSFSCNRCDAFQSFFSICEGTC